MKSIYPKKISFCFFLIMISLLTFSCVTHSITVTGTVIDDTTSLPIEGVNVTLTYDSSKSTTTKSDGSFSITVDYETFDGEGPYDQAYMFFEKTGYASEYINTDNSNDINNYIVKLKPQ